MRLTAIIALGVLLSGCGTTSILSGDQNTDFVLVSCSKAGGMYAFIRGDVEACKVTVHGSTLADYQIVFDGQTMTVETVKQ